MTIKNNSEPRTVNLDYFHIKNKTKDFVTTTKVFSKEFQDLGNTYDTVTKLNRTIRMFPTNLVAPMLGIVQRDYLKAEESKQQMPSMK